MNQTNKTAEEMGLYPTLVKNLKQGTLFKVSASLTAPYWVRGEYCRFAKKYSCHRYKDVNHENMLPGARRVWVEIEDYKPNKQ